jgi:hypothetical protein
MPNRYICSVLEEMRTCIETLNFSILLSLIEEVQVMANRMEAKLYDMRDHEDLLNDIKDKKKELKILVKELKEKKEEKE